MRPAHEQRPADAQQLVLSREQLQVVLGQLREADAGIDDDARMAAKTMALKIYYALDEHEVLYAHLEAFVKYIRRKPGLGYHRQNYLTLARYTQKLLALNWNDKNEVLALREKIEAEKALTERDWLLEQLARS